MHHNIKHANKLRSNSNNLTDKIKSQSWALAHVVYSRKIKLKLILFYFILKKNLASLLGLGSYR